MGARITVENLRAAVLINHRLDCWQQAEERAMGEPHQVLYIRETLFLRLRCLIQGAFRANAILFSPEMLPFALYAATSLRAGVNPGDSPPMNGSTTAASMRGIHSAAPGGS
uniref:Uncharacterized protein n=1 Tax=Chromera velia CCMP2878 TaxID=1169474 RepID=A0A0G4HMI0_9ALVE|eukprot:Cvel_29269.t1-p1 / transcript=Cvel_29269.t1 / gene=Cvel_29269 / organism=Chromera_velia_CCMP2878 / gene_product=hypothetical protein / transcript_product=hypothetical protein / location=Cvel_scaffold3973:2797-3126(+) / protein_length=110 / sequence_SO=supercontig / SO=protein_coding / is_pseudo=false